MQAVLTKSRLQLDWFTSAIESCEENLTDECDDLINSEVLDAPYLVCEVV